jgi:hypothetical protein
VVLHGAFGQTGAYWGLREQAMARLAAVRAGARVPTPLRWVGAHRLDHGLNCPGTRLIVTLSPDFAATDPSSFCCSCVFSV